MCDDKYGNNIERYFKNSKIDRKDWKFWIVV